MDKYDDEKIWHNLERFKAFLLKTINSEHNNDIPTALYKK